MISYLSKRLKTALLIALTVVAVAGLPAQRASAETVIDVPTADPEMAAAIAKARASLPMFWASYEAPKPSEDGHSGRFANEPVHLPGKHVGDLIEFTEADISDWMFMRSGKIVGGETIRPLLKSMPKAEAAALRARMENP